MIGDLVWGRMPGFPWWPSFVTRNPENIYKKPVAFAADWNNAEKFLTKLGFWPFGLV